MYLLQSWFEGLAIFKPANLKLFLLVVLKTIINTYKTLFNRFYALLIGSLVCQVAFAMLVEKNVLIPKTIPYTVGYLFTEFATLILYFLLYLCARPSTSIKDYNYLKQHIPHFLLSILFLLFITGLAGISSSLIASSVLEFLIPLCVIIFTPMIIFFILFLLDAKPSSYNFFASIWRSFLMLLYNLPFCLIWKLIMVGIVWVAASAFLKLNLIYSSPLLIGLLNLFFELTKVIPICIFTVFYTKRLHEQFDLYFRTKGH